MYVLVTLTCIYGPARGKNRHNLFVVNFSEKKCTLSILVYNLFFGQTMHLLLFPVI